jgi:SAM-dependent methyltransferase
LTDVLHHVPDLPQLFAELRRCLAPSGLLCIVTESHSQIAARFYNIYFPSLRENEIRRYPSISKILDAATLQNLIHLHTESLQHACTRSIDPDFIDTVSAKSFSMFHALSATEFTEGLAALIADQGRTFPPGEAGMTLVWFRRASHNGSDLLSR